MPNCSTSRPVPTSAGTSRRADHAGGHRASAPRGLVGQQIIDIAQVRDAAALEAHVLATAIGFGAPDASAMKGVMPPSLLEDDRVTFFNGYVDGMEVPAATAVSVVTEGVAGIYAITVHEAARRRGFGTAMTWAGVSAGARVGVGTAILQSSDMGRPVYERMGFTQIRAHHRYRPARGT